MAKKNKKPPERDTLAKDAEIHATELVFHEIGEILAASSESINREFAQYETGTGSYHVGELELELAVVMRVDELGQLRARIVDEVPEKTAVSRVRLKVLPRPSSEVPHRPMATQSLEVFDNINEALRNRLAQFRIFSAEDLSRVTRRAPGYASMKKILGKSLLQDMLSSIDLLSSPGIGAELGMILVNAGIRRTSEIIQRPAADIADLLSETSGKPVDPDTISKLQDHLKTIEE